MEDKKQESVFLIADDLSEGYVHRVQQRFGHIAGCASEATSATMALMAIVREGHGQEIRVVSTVRLGDRSDGGMAILDTLQALCSQDNVPRFVFMEDGVEVPALLRGYVRHKGCELVAI